MKNPQIPSPTRRITCISTVAALLGLVAVIALPRTALAYDASADFSTSINPNGVWSYGWSTTLGSAFNLDTSNTTAAYGLSGLAGWFSNQSAEGVPSILRNTTANPLAIGTFTQYQPGQLALNMNGSEYSVLRWTAPSSGQFNIAATFSAVSTIGATSDVHIQTNGISIFDSAVNGFPAPTSFAGTVSLVSGDHIDFAVGFGSNGNDHEDTTALAATIVAVPEPGTLALVSTALGALFSLRFLKRK
jgi:hypothetical protein